MPRRWSRIASSATSSNRDCGYRARRHAGAAARAGVAVYLRNWRYADAGAEPDCSDRTVVAAGPALGSPSRQAIGADCGFDRPGPDLQFAVLQCAMHACLGACAAKAATSAREVDHRVAALQPDDALGACGNTLPTARAACQKQRFCQRPWRAQRRTLATKPATQEIPPTHHRRILSSANGHGHSRERPSDQRQVKSR